MLAILLQAGLVAQVYSPIVTKTGQADTSNLQALTRDIYAEAAAKTPRERAEAIWRFFLTDGRFAKPGIFYHIAGWAYEEPKGEVLDPLKLLNSYGFGLCYHIAPLLEAVFEAGGFRDARVWFLTGHTVAEVFYDGQYHYFDSDMLGYNNTDSGVASVHQIEKDGRIITEQLKREHGEPWYPADVRANAIGGLAELFTTTKDNYLFPFQRYSQGHTMDFVLRPGERMIRNFRPSDDRTFYLPFLQEKGQWSEFPQEIAQYDIRTSNGPRSQKDSRLWGTGRIEYQPDSPASSFTIEMPSPYVVIDAEFSMQLEVEANDELKVETSIDGAKHWEVAARLAGPHKGAWKASPRVIAKGEHGQKSAVSGSYGYRVRFTSRSAKVRDLLLATQFAVNPRALPALTSGVNEFQVRSADHERRALPIPLDRIGEVGTLQNAEYVVEGGQGFVRNRKPGVGRVTFYLASSSGFDVGARFLDLRDGIAPDKRTAETRAVSPWPKAGSSQSASISWATSPNGPWQELWTYNPKLEWLDGQAIDRTLRWPEVDKSVRDLPKGSGGVYIRYAFDGMAVDDFRIASYRQAANTGSPLWITHVWSEDGVEKRIQKRLEKSSGRYSVEAKGTVDNVAVILECPKEM